MIDVASIRDLIEPGLATETLKQVGAIMVVTLQVALLVAICRQGRREGGIVDLPMEDDRKPRP